MLGTHPRFKPCNSLRNATKVRSWIVMILYRRRTQNGYTRPVRFSTRRSRATSDRLVASWGIPVDSSVDDSGSEPASPAARRLSYKFQRLRERIRAAIDAGELAGKLPGERSLARQFNVNAKTLSKALTDLAAEGVLKRNIGLGTFVRDESALPVPQKILLLAASESNSLATTLTDFGLDVQHHAPAGELLPSLFAPFDLVLVASHDIEDEQV